jgi:cellulose synthase/poly-beta-1,6-N-acetylglucosamine synthase-like glycosyltransferase
MSTTIGYHDSHCIAAYADGDAASPPAAARASRPRFWASSSTILGVVGVAFTLVVATAAGLTLLDEFGSAAGSGRLPEAAGYVIYLFIVCFLVYGSLVYQMTRLAYRYRLCTEANDESHVRHWRGRQRRLVILIPSYKEEPDVIRMTLISAALQRHPDKRVVLLIDDPPQPNSAADAAALTAARNLACQLHTDFLGFAGRARDLRDAIIDDTKAGSLAYVSDGLKGLIDDATRWLNSQPDIVSTEPHIKAIFKDKVIVPVIDALSEDLACVTRSLAATGQDSISLVCVCQRLLEQFSVEIASFERKRYANLSHEPNKAMNLNSYIGLLGGSFAEQESENGLLLLPAAGTSATIQVPAADYLITLDADSLIVPGYADVLLSVCERSGNERIAVAQTPYSAFPNAPRLIERIAGATTDIQYCIHQGFTAFGATFWVGANALLRVTALRDIEEQFEERGFRMSRFIQDRTVIEDTESSIDLATKGWLLYNYPARLSYSATPPDFGALTVQRARWANGGLIILGKLLRYLASAASPTMVGEGLMRIHYLTSIAAVNIGLMLLLWGGLVDETPVWLPLIAVPYFVAYAVDLRYVGYRCHEVFHVYALNLLLLPVNLAGVWTSLKQLVSGKTIPFARTPKVAGRTRTPKVFLLAALGLIGFCLAGAARDFSAERWEQLVFGALHACILAYAVIAFVGIREVVEDLAYAARRRNA